MILKTQSQLLIYCVSVRAKLLRSSADRGWDYGIRQKRITMNMGKDNA